MEKVSKEKELEIENSLLKRLFEVISIRYGHTTAEIVALNQEIRDLNAQLKNRGVPINLFERLKNRLKYFFLKFYFLFRHK